MDAYQQPPPSYARPPPGPLPTADPYHNYYQNQARPPAPPPPQPTWHPNQFQYSHSPSPPPPPPPHWCAPPPLPPSEHLPQPHSFSAYPPPLPPPPPPYPAHPQFPLPASPAAPPPLYPPVNQEWGANTNWGYQAQSNTEDWAAKAREWAAAKAGADNQHPQSQFTPESRPGEQSGFHEQYAQSAGSHYQGDPHHQDPQQRSVSASSYQRFLDASATPQYEHLPYPVEDGRFPGVSTVGFSHQASLSTSSTINQQEVPSSYSSVTGKDDGTDQKEQSYKSPPLPMSTGQLGQHEEHYAYGNHAADPSSNISNHPLHFAPRVTPDEDPHLQSSYASLPNGWAPPVQTGVGYPPIPSLHSAPQHDPSVAVPSVSGHTVPPFGRFPPPNFQPAVPSAGAPYNLTARPSLHPPVAFFEDSYGSSAVPDRPKKASVPNWLREEILKKKATLGKSSLEKLEEETKSIEDEVIHKSVVKANQADSKSFDSTKSTDDEEEEEDEDYVEAARTAAINQEIKRILTEVLLKVTDELFDEIATKVISENATLEDEHEEVQTHRASAKIVIPNKVRGSETVGVSRNSGSESPGDVLGLANYASDDDDDDDEDEDEVNEDNKVQIGGLTNSRDNVLKESSVEKLSEHDAADNGRLESELKDQISVKINKENDLIETGVPEAKDDKSAEHASEAVSIDRNDKVDGVSTKVLKTPEEKAELPGKRADLNTNIRHETRKNSGKEASKELDKTRSRSDDKQDEDHRRHDEKRLGKEKTDYLNGSNDRTKVQNVKPAEKIKEHESKKRSTHVDVKEDKIDSERLLKANSKEDTDRKRVREKEEGRSRHKHATDSSTEKRRRTSPASDESSDDSRRKSHSRKRNLSPSPVRSRRRQVSRSPHSKHSQHKHSPYSSLEKTSRGRRSRSRSPHRRRR